MTEELLGRRHVDVDIIRLEGTVEQHSHQISQLLREGCAHRADADRRLLNVETAQVRIFEHLDADRRSASDFRESVLETIGEIRKDIAEGISGVRIWVLVGVVICAVGVIGWLADKYVYPSIAPNHGHSAPSPG